MSAHALVGQQKLQAPFAPLEFSLTQQGLSGYLGAGAVTEMLIQCCGDDTYRLEASLSWRSGRGVLIAARGGPRVFHSLDTVAKFLRSIGSGSTLIRLELKP